MSKKLVVPVVPAVPAVPAIEAVVGASISTLPEIPPPNVADEFAGQGGSYTLDPATGKRTRNA